jgi:hypothetical protein
MRFTSLPLRLIKPAFNERRFYSAGLLKKEKLF